jgi:multidrug transporter EmrE-like cation transporter
LGEDGIRNPVELVLVIPCLRALAIMALAGILFFDEAPSWQRIVGVAFAIIGLFFLRR